MKRWVVGVGIPANGIQDMNSNGKISRQNVRRKCLRTGALEVKDPQETPKTYTIVGQKLIVILKSKDE
jgi:hypothetical protein